MNQQQFQQKKTPIAAIKDILASNKITFIAVFYSITVLFSMISAFAERNEFGSFSLFGFDIDLKEVEMVGDIVETMANAILIFTIIGLIPQIASAIAFWLLKIGSNDGSGNSKKALLGLNFFKAVLLLNGITQYCLSGGVLLLTLILLFVGLPSNMIFIVLLAGILVAGFFLLSGKYYTDFLTMLYGVSNTLRTGRNLVVKSSFVIVINWIVGIYSIVSGVFSVFGCAKNETGASLLLTVAIGVCEGLSIIFINNCFKTFNNECGYATKEDVKATYEAFRFDPAYRAEADALGVVQTDRNNPTPPKSNLFNLLFGMSVVNGEPAPYQGNQYANAHQAQNAYQPQGAYAPKNNYAPVRDGYQPAYQPSAVYAASSTEARVLTLFGKYEEPIDPRFRLMGNRGEALGFACPAVPFATQIFVDSVSEKKILRAVFRNASPVAISSLKIEITPKNNQGASLGSLYNTFSFADAAAPGSLFADQFGIMIPDGTTNGEIKIVGIEFADGLTWDKTSAAAEFTTDEKAAYDAEMAAAAERARIENERAAYFAAMRQQQQYYGSQSGYGTYNNQQKPEEKKKSYGGIIAVGIILGVILIPIILMWAITGKIGCGSLSNVKPLPEAPQNATNQGNETVEVPMGTEENPYLIQSGSDLQMLVEKVNGGYSEYGAHYKLCANLNLEHYDWTPIGTPEHPFTGVFDGNYYSIDCLHIDNQTYAPQVNEYDSAFLGLFGYVDINATIKNLTLTNVSIDLDSNSYNNICCGSIAGYSSGNIENCYADGTIRINSDTPTVGGLVGCFEGSFTSGMTDCESCFDITVNSTNTENSGSDRTLVGGLIGISYSPYVIDCNFNGNIYVSSDNDDSYCGGIVGEVSGGYFSYVYSNATITSTCANERDEAYSTVCGGLIGESYNGPTKVTCSSAWGSISVDSNASIYTGGLIGYANANIENCNASTDITVISNRGYVGRINSGIYVGGILGIARNATVTNVYSLSNISVRSMNDAFIFAAGIVGAGAVPEHSNESVGVYVTNALSATTIDVFSEATYNYSYSDRPEKSILVDTIIAYGYSYSAENCYYVNCFLLNAYCENDPEEIQINYYQSTSCSESNLGKYFFENTLDWSRDIWDYSPLYPSIAPPPEENDSYGH